MRRWSASHSIACPPRFWPPPRFRTAGVAASNELHPRPSVTRALRRSRRLGLQLPPHMEDALEHRERRQERHPVDRELQGREVSHGEDLRKEQADREDHDPYRTCRKANLAFHAERLRAST